MIEIIERTNYLDKLKALQNKSVIKVVTGVRRCGKSVLLESFQKWLISNGIKKNNIISINFEDYEYTVSTRGGGNASFVGGNGDITYGGSETVSEEENTQR